VTYYYTELQAYRSDRFTGMVAMPQPGGPVLFQPAGYWSYRTLGPVSAEAATKSGGPNIGVFAGGGAAVIVVLAGGYLLIRRRRTSTADERE
jgi:peptide/nickel transport system substrate-binding protein